MRTGILTGHFLPLSIIPALALLCAGPAGAGEDSEAKTNKAAGRDGDKPRLTKRIAPGETLDLSAGEFVRFPVIHGAPAPVFHDAVSRDKNIRHGKDSEDDRE